MKTRFIPVILGTATWFLQSSCFKNDLASYTFYYYVEYHTYSNETVAGYILEQDGTYNIAPDNNEELLMNGDAGYHTSEYDYYAVAIFSGLEPEVEFMFKAPVNERFSTVAYLSDIETIAIPDLPDEIDHHSDLEIAWLGAPLASGERIDIEFGESPGHLYYDYTEVPGSTSFTIPDHVLNDYIYEDLTIKLIRSRTIPFSNPETSGEVRLEYHSDFEFVFID